MSQGELREYLASARSTDIFGRVLCNARDQHFVIDGPTWNGCPGEALTPGEAFMASIAACGVELVQVIAAEEGIPVAGIQVRVQGVVDRERPVREDVTVFNRARIEYDIGGVGENHAAELVDGVKRRCPLYGSLAASTPELEVEVRAG